MKNKITLSIASILLLFITISCDPKRKDQTNDAMPIDSIVVKKDTTVIGVDSINNIK